MKGFFSILILLFCMGSIVHSQSLVLSRTLNLLNGTYPFDRGNQIIAVDSNTFLCGVNLGLLSHNFGIYYYKPTFILVDSLFNPKDTIHFRDTVSQTKITYDRKYKNVWMVSSPASYNRYRLRRVTLQGQVLFNDLYPNNNSNFQGIGSTFNAYPDEEGGLYLLGTKGIPADTPRYYTTSISRFDSTGFLLWQKQYDAAYLGGPSEHMEKLPNGNLFIFGQVGRNDISYMEVEPINGELVSSRVLYTSPFTGFNIRYGTSYVSRTVNGGYFISGSSLNVPTSLIDSGAFMVSLDSNLRTNWAHYSSHGTFKTMSCTDTSVWVARADSSFSYSFEHYRTDTFSRLHKIIVYRNNQSRGVNPIVDFATRRNRQIDFIGTINSPNSDGALFFNKLANIGVAYNPFYQPYPPLPPSVDTLATQIKGIEPALQIYPNPGHNSLYISHTGDLYLYNMQGLLVVQKSLQVGDIINTASLASGCYLARFRTRTAWLQAKWVKE